MLFRKGKKQIRGHTVLSNGQVASIYFRLHRNEKFDDGLLYDCWYVGFRIGNSRRQNNDWWGGKKVHNGDAVTGRCGLEGLIWAKSQLKAFVDKTESPDYCQLLIVGGEDHRRLSAYRWLKKDGFTEGNYDGEDVFIKEF